MGSKQKIKSKAEKAAEQPEEEKKPKVEKKQPKPEEKKLDVRRLTRIKDTDVDGDLSVIMGMTQVKGIGYNIANAICTAMGIDRMQRIGDLSEAQIRALEDAMMDPAKVGVPSWMFNRRKDLDTGLDKHLITSDLIFQKKQDIDLMGEIKSYKGLRHAKGLKVRGQRTASTGRGKNVVGVQRRKDAKAGRV